MDTTWGFYFPMFWIFPLLGMIVMVVMMFMRGGMGCMHSGGSTGHRADDRHETPRQILDRRYASGEITREQYEQTKRDIEAAQDSAARP